MGFITTISGWLEASDDDGSHDNGREYCAAVPMAASAIENYVVERVTEIVGAGEFGEESYGALAKRLQERVELLKTQQHSLAERIGEISARSGRLADEWVSAGIDVKDVLGQRLATASAELKHCELALAEVRTQLSIHETRKFDVEWVARALSNFREVWAVMSTVNQGRLLRALSDHIVIDQDSGKVDVHLAYLDEACETSELIQTEAAQ